MNNQREILISFHDANRKLAERLSSYLNGILDEPVSVKMHVGVELTELKESILRAEIFVLLLSEDYYNSEFIQKVELPAIHKEHKRREVQIIPIITSSLRWNAIPWLNSYLATASKLLPGSSNDELKRVFDQISNEITTLLKSSQTSQSPQASQVPQAPQTTQPRPTRKKLVHIADPVPHFTGRITYLETISEWFQSSVVKVGSLEGFGGRGKTSIARQWYDEMQVQETQPEGIFWWGFYKNSSIDAFFDALLQFVSKTSLSSETPPSAYQKTELILEALKGSNYLIILDGFEELQHPEESGGKFGQCRQTEMREFLQGLCDSSFAGLCLVTTRYSLKDIENWEGRKSFQRIEVETLSLQEGLEFLEDSGIKGSKKARKALVKEYEGDALCLSLMAGLLTRLYGGKAEKAKEIPPLALNRQAGERIKEILQWYDKHLSEEERTLLQIHSLFRQKVTEELFSIFLESHSYNEVLQGRSDFELRGLLEGLLQKRFLTGSIEEGLDSHPLVRDYFAATMGEEAKRDCHKAIYRHIEKAAPDEPETLEAMAPYFSMVRHGCAAGLYDEVFKEVYMKKVQRVPEYFLTHTLGAWETCLSLLREFFPYGNLEQQPLALSRFHQGSIMNDVAVSLQSIGHPREAVPLYQRSNKISKEKEDWVNASIGYSNLASLQLRCGELKQSFSSASEALEAANLIVDQKPEKVEIILALSYRSWIHFLMDEKEEAEKGFQKVAALQKEAIRSPLHFPSTFYPSFLLRSGHFKKALLIAEDYLATFIEQKIRTRISRFNRLLGEIRTATEEYELATKNIDAALTEAREIGVPVLEIEALLARGQLFLKQKEDELAENDALRAMSLIERTTFYLYKPDALNILAEAAWLNKEPQKALELLEESKSEAEEMGYALAIQDALKVEAKISQRAETLSPQRIVQLAFLLVLGKRAEPELLITMKPHDFYNAVRPKKNDAKTREKDGLLRLERRLRKTYGDDVPNSYWFAWILNSQEENIQKIINRYP